MYAGIVRKKDNKFEWDVVDIPHRITTLESLYPNGLIDKSKQSFNTKSNAIMDCEAKWHPYSDSPAFNWIDFDKTKLVSTISFYAPHELSNEILTEEYLKKIAKCTKWQFDEPRFTKKDVNFQSIMDEQREKYNELGNIINSINTTQMTKAQIYLDLNNLLGLSKSLRDFYKVRKPQSMAIDFDMMSSLYPNSNLATMIHIDPILTPGYEEGYNEEFVTQYTTIGTIKNNRVYYFAYGSNCLEQQMLERCPTSRFEDFGYIENHSLIFPLYSDTWGGGVADIYPSEGNTVYGIIYSLELDDLLQNMDKSEGVAQYRYERKKAKVKRLQTDENENVYLYTVMKLDNILPSIPPSDLYYNTIIAGLEQHLSKITDKEKAKKVKKYVHNI